METKGILIGVALLAAGLLGLSYLTNSSTGERAYEIFPDMLRSPAARSLSESSVLPNGMVQQTLVSGTVVHGSSDYGFGLGAEECSRAGRELISPIAADDFKATERGAALYARYCTPCHAVNGEGMGPVVLRGFPPPPSFKAARAMSLKDGELHHILTRGQNGMASYAAQLSIEERWMVVRHIRTLQGAK
jgi:mono/diheme cytochrome c family protein